MKTEEVRLPDSNMDQFSTYVMYDELDMVEQDIERQKILENYRRREN
jgi:hypothetical protein